MNNRKAWTHQIENVEAGLKRHILIVDDCGLGKTLSAIETAKAIRAQRPEWIMINWRALVVCPKSVRAQWVAEIGDLDPGVPCQILALDEDPGDEAVGWYVTHYEAIIRNPPVDLLWDVHIIDEAHRIKNRKAKRTKANKEIQSLRRIGLTGTPMEKDPSDMWSILNWLYPNDFSSFWNFRAKYCEIGLNEWGYEVIKGPKNVDDLAIRLRGRLLRHTKEQVADSLPPKIFAHPQLLMEEKQAQTYESIRDSRDIELFVANEEKPEMPRRIVIANALAKVIRLQQAASCHEALGDGFSFPSAKIDWAMDLIADNPGQQIVVFAKFVKTARAVCERLNAEGYEYDEFFGGSSRTGYPTRFIEGSVPILVASIAQGGEGMDLKDATMAIFIDLDWSGIKMHQAVERIHRIGSVGVRMIYWLVASPIDQLIIDKVENKWSDRDAVYKALERSIL